MKRPDPFVGALARPELVVERSRPALNAITESDLFRGYSGLVDARSFPPPSIETVRSRVAAAYGALAADGVGSREDLAAPDDVASPALER